MKIALKKGVRGAISQKAALGILIYIHQIHLFIIPVHEEMSKFTEMKVTLEMNSGELQQIKDHFVLWGFLRNIIGLKSITKFLM